jgi:hypothetical protein
MSFVMNPPNSSLDMVDSDGECAPFFNDVILQPIHLNGNRFFVI